MIFKKNIPTYALVDLIIWFLMLILFIYDGFIKQIPYRIVWLIAAFLMLISVIIKFKYIRYEKRNRRKGK